MEQDFGWLDDVICIGATQSDPIVSTEQEVARYLSEPMSDVPVLQWWKDREAAYPTLSKLAKKYLAIPALLQREFSVLLETLLIKKDVS